MNYRISLVIFALIIILSQIQAKEVGLQKAEKTAENIFYERLFTAHHSTENIAVVSTWIERQDELPLFYIFNFDGGGFVIVPGDDALMPVLGYSLVNDCPGIGLNPDFDSFMEGYAEQVRYVRSHSVEATEEVSGMWEYYSEADISQHADGKDVVVSPLLTCMWNQDYPYNMLCPENSSGPGGHVYAGCVATAMSMVMDYWRYPLQGNGSHGYTWDPYGYISADFGATEYNWNQMMNKMDPDYSDVALIQFHCGVAVEMMYSPNGSGAYSSDVPPAIKNYFSYSQNAQYVKKENYSPSGWVNLLKGQLDQKQPMYYSGFTGKGGHAFVCDGYDDNDYFHFNFGWGGSSNGYYSLTNVNGFHLGQGAVINFVPGDNYPYYFTGQQILTAKSGSFEDGSGPKENYLPDADVSWLIDPQQPGDSVASITLVFSRFEVASGDNVTIYDGGTTESEVLAVLSGTDLPQPVTSTGNKMLVVFKSSNAGTANGFLAEYTTELPVWCNGLTQLSAPQASFSDGSMEFNYYNNTVCMWRIEPEVPGATTLYFTAFDTEPNNDVVKIYDLDTQELLAEYSGDYNGGVPDPVTAPGGKLFVAFSTNKDVVHSGWDAYYVNSTVAVNETDGREEHITIFPNPASGHLNIDLSLFDETGVEIEIFGMDGKRYINRIVSSNADNLLTLNIEALPRGVYTIRFTTENHPVIVKKLVVKP